MQVGEERVYLAYTSTLLFITKGSQDWNSNRSGSRSWCRSHGGMFFTGLLPLACSYRTQDYQPRDGPTHKGTFPHDHKLRKCLKAFPNWSSFLCDNSSLCQVDTKLASTPGVKEDAVEKIVGRIHKLQKNKPNNYLLRAVDLGISLSPGHDTHLEKNIFLKESHIHLWLVVTW